MLEKHAPDCKNYTATHSTIEAINHDGGMRQNHLPQLRVPIDDPRAQVLVDTSRTDPQHRTVAKHLFEYADQACA
jgi:hypothetical protein